MVKYSSAFREEVILEYLTGGEGEFGTQSGVNHKIRDNHYIVNQDLSAYSFLGKN